MHFKLQHSNGYALYRASGKGSREVGWEEGWEECVGEGRGGVAAGPYP